MDGPGNRNSKHGHVPCQLASRIGDLLGSLDGQAFAPFLADWPQEWCVGQPSAPGTLPVVSWIEKCAADERAFGRPVIAELCRVAPRLAWQQTYTATEVGEEFLHNYGWTEIVGAAGPLVSERLACGFLLLGPDTHYPPHQHAAQETYVPLSGAARWQQGDGVWRERPPGSVIHHASGEPHAMHTGAQPLLALYLWRGAQGKSTMLN